MKRLILLVGVLMTSLLSASGQILNIDPAFPTQNDTVTIVYDASQGNGALVGVVPVYAHAGLITNASTSPSDWQNVQGNWGTADPNTLMTPLGNNLHEISYHIPTYYGFSPGTVVQKLAFVFRDQSGGAVGRATDGSDIFYDVYPANAGFLAKFFSPESVQTLGQGQTIDFVARSNEDATLTIFDNGVQVAQVTGAQEINHTQTVSGSGQHLVELVATNGTTTVTDTVYYVANPGVQIIPAPQGIVDGINYINDSTVILQLHAPFKNNIYVIGDFNGWLPDSLFYMHKDPSGQKWWIQIDGLTPGQEYGFQYLIDGNLRIADPYSEVVLDPYNDPWIPSSVYPNLHPYPTGLTTGIATLMFPGKTPYSWQNTSYAKPDQTELNIYELLIRDFADEHSYQVLIDTLNYIQNLGINAIELMPNSEFEGNESWGYNPSFHMALDKYYGTIDAYKAFIDSCHGRGIAVIMDFVFNHSFGQSPLAQMYWDEAGNKPASNNPWYNTDCPHPPNCWGNDFDHTAQATQDFIDRVNTYWFEEFKIDGVRYDFTKGFTNSGDVSYDNTRIQLLKRMADTVWAVNPEAYIILEHWADNNEESQLSDYGMMLWGQATHQYQEAAMGWVSSSNFNGAVYQFRGWNDAHLVTFPESHDEERIMFKNLTFGNSNNVDHDVKDLNTALGRTTLTHIFGLAHPGPKMMWMFGELGYDISIDDPCRVCNKPILWQYYDDPARKAVYNNIAALLKLRNDQSIMHTTDFGYNFNGAVKKLHLNSPSINGVLLGNFAVTASTTNPQFQHAGTWYEYFTGDSIVVTDPTAAVNLAPGQYVLYFDQPIESPTIGLEEDLSSADARLSVFPNPAAGSIFIHSDGTEDELSLEWLDMQARVLSASRHDASTGQTGPVSTQELPNGLYMLRISGDHTHETHKILIQH